MKKSSRDMFKKVMIGLLVFAFVASIILPVLARY